MENYDDHIIEFDSAGRMVFESYFLDGKLHRIDGPAFIRYHKSGKAKCEQYWLDGKIHRIPGPAAIWYDQYGNTNVEAYWFDGQRHRGVGPAQIWYYKGRIEHKAYWLNGELINVELAVS